MADTPVKVARLMAELRTALTGTDVPETEIPVMVGAAGGVLLAMRT